MSFLPKWVALAVALVASIALLLGPTSASAAVTSEERGNELIVKGDGADDTITLTINGIFIAVNGVKASTVFDQLVEITVEAGGGNDKVDARALNGEYRSLNVTG